MKMKRIAAMLLATVLIMTMSACSKGNDTADESSVPSSDTSSEATDESSEGSESVGKEKVINTTMWDLTYDEADGWVYDPDKNFSEGDDYANLTIRIPEEDDENYDYLNVYIQANVTTPYNFRDDLVELGFDEYEYEVNHAYELTNLGGIDCVSTEREAWGSTLRQYLGRDEASSVTVTLEIVGDCSDERLDKLLSGLTFKTDDIGNEDGPWYWEGEPFFGQGNQVDVGGYTLTSTWVPFEESLCTHEIFENVGKVYGEVAYVLVDGALKQFAYDGESFTYPVDIPLDEEYAYMSLDYSGNLWLSDFGCPLTEVTNGEAVVSCDDFDYVVMDPIGTWGISWFTSQDCEMFALGGDEPSVMPITFAELSTVNEIFIDDNNIYVCGFAADDSGHKVFVYDYDFNLKLTLDSEDESGLGSITYVAETENGFIALDGNMREVVLWDKSGSYIGAADDEELFGTDYPWFCGACELDDGSFMVFMTDKRADKSATELLAFKLSGF